MVDWEQVRQDLAAAGYPGFERETGETAVPGLSGAWVVGEVPREGRLERATLPLPWRLLDALPFVSALQTDPERVPDGVWRVADEHGLAVVVVSAGQARARIALCEPE